MFVVGFKFKEEEHMTLFEYEIGDSSKLTLKDLLGPLVGGAETTVFDKMDVYYCESETKQWEKVDVNGYKTIIPQNFQYMSFNGKAKTPISQQEMLARLAAQKEAADVK
ncbi:hypothetical protein GGF41_008129, partial [Coemansia sp. RSA 2531]